METIILLAVVLVVAIVVLRFAYKKNIGEDIAEVSSVAQTVANDAKADANIIKQVVTGNSSPAALSSNNIPTSPAAPPKQS